MGMIGVVCFRCSECDRIYEGPEAPKECVCERHVYIKGERFGSFIIEESLEGGKVKVKCILCDNFSTVMYNNIRKQQSCGCKPKSAEILDLNEEVLVYRCRKCGKTITKRLPIVSYCCEE